MTDTDAITTVSEIMRSTRIAALSYLSLEGDLVSVWFITERSTDKVRALAHDPRVNVHYAGKGGWVSLAGTARYVDDRERLRELWDSSADVFMDGSPDDPDNGLLQITATSAEYWDSPGAVATAVQLVKGLVSDATPDLGDSGVVPL